MLYDCLQEKRQLILKSATEHGITNVRIFGSVARHEYEPGSDLDLLVQLEQDRSLFNLIRFKHEMEDLLGVTVDVVTENSIHQHIKEAVLKSAVHL